MALFSDCVAFKDERGHSGGGRLEPEAVILPAERQAGVQGPAAGLRRHPDQLALQRRLPARRRLQQAVRHLHQRGHQAEHRGREEVLGPLHQAQAQLQLHRKSHIDKRTGWVRNPVANFSRD